MTRDREGRGGEAVGVLSRSGPERQWDGTVKSKLKKEWCAKEVEWRTR
jgi:hypothetical protein